MLRSLFICCCFILLSACSSTQTYAPVVNGWKNAQSSQYYVVQPGDTLYSIAWAFGIDYNDLVRINHLKSPYKIQTGQRLKMTSVVAKAAKPTAKNIQTPIVTTKSIQKNQNKKIITQKPIETVQQNIVSYPQRNVGSWIWPTKGRIIAGFSNQNGGNRGLDIAGHLGQPVMAAANGEVVYTGTGIRGYGRLIIIKHNQTFLSAYAQNQNILVKEGQAVKKGQLIASMGRTDGGQVLLHFEIRKSGKPVNPLVYLPKNG